MSQFSDKWLSVDLPPPALCLPKSSVGSHSAWQKAVGSAAAAHLPLTLLLFRELGTFSFLGPSRLESEARLPKGREH